MARAKRAGRRSSASATAPLLRSGAHPLRRGAPPNEPPPGLMHVELGGYHVGDIEVASAFDVHAGKVGRDVGEAIFAAPEQHLPLRRRRGHGRARCERGPTLDGIGRYLADEIEEADARAGRRGRGAAAHRDRRARLLPAGRLAAGDRVLRRAGAGGRLRLRQLHPGLHRLGSGTGRGASRSAACRSSATTSRARSAPPSCTGCSPTCSASAGVRLDRTYQLNFGGNTDFKNMLERERLISKKISKTQAVTSQLDVPLDERRRPCRPERLRAVAERPQVGAHPHGGHDLRRRAAQRRAEARGLGQPELGRHRHRRGALRQARRSTAASAGRCVGPSSYFMKSPPEQFTDHEARERTLRFIAGEEPSARLMSASRWRRIPQAARSARASRLGQWFHNLDLDGVQTAPDHFLRDYPDVEVAALRLTRCRPT